MSTAPSAQPSADGSPRLKARIAGLLYVVIIIAALFGEIFVRSRLVVSNNAAATAANILAHQRLYRLGGVADLIAFACDTAVAVIFYELLKTVNRSGSLFAASFRIVYAGIVGVNTLWHFAPLVLLGATPWLNAFTPEQVQALALVSLKLHGGGYNIALVFFGFHCLLIGYLIFRSTFLPRVLGALVAAAGLCYLINSFATFVAPALKAHIYPYILMPAAIGEWSLTIWLLIVGLNTRRWQQQAGARNLA